MEDKRIEASERYEKALSEGRLGPYEAQLVFGQRKRIGKRHAARNQARKSRKKNR